MTLTIFLIRLSLAFILGAIVGAERQVRQKSAGLRTNTLVSIGAAAFILMSYEISDNATGRVASYVVSGIGFLGAGVIMKDGFSIRGLNTAATIWCSAAVGSLCAVGSWPHAIILTCLVVSTHVLLRPIGVWINKLSFDSDTDTSEIHYHIIVGCKESVENKVRERILTQIKQQKSIQMRSLKSSDNGNPAFSFLKYELYCIGRKDDILEEITQSVSLQTGVSEATWELTHY